MRRTRASRCAAGVLGVLLAAAFVVDAARADPNVVLPSTVGWKELRTERFDLRWRIPVDRHPDLGAPLRRMIALEIPAWTVEEDRPPVRSVGDLIAEFGRVRQDLRGRRALWQRLKRERVKTYRAVRRFLPGLLWDDDLRSEDWDPDEGGQDDGILIGNTISLAKFDAWPWRELEGSNELHQAAALIWADLATIKEEENDYTSYLGHKGSTYEYIHAVPRTYVRGQTPDGKPFSTLRIAFRCDLPFPYSTYDCDLKILNTVNPDGHLVTDIYSTSPDFYWMAGQDVFVPIRRSDGSWVAMLLVRVFGFDLRSVPDGSDARDASLRSSIGNLKLKAERAFRRRAGETPTAEGTVPVFRVRGVKQD